jgi:hypothetical protein
VASMKARSVPIADPHTRRIGSRVRHSVLELSPVVSAATLQNPDGKA